MIIYIMSHLQKFVCYPVKSNKNEAFQNIPKVTNVVKVDISNDIEISGGLTAVGPGKSKKIIQSISSVIDSNNPTQPIQVSIQVQK